MSIPRFPACRAPSLRLLLALPVLLAACGDATTTPTGGSLAVEATIEPDPPKVGQNVLRVTVKNAAAEPVPGANVKVDPQMPAHGHGSTETPTVTEEGSGRYLASPVTFQMPGRWEVRVVVTAGAGQTGSTVLSRDVK
ncbi:MAG: FixH family protein [Deltaproteobacteria bacterium]|nr:FixH family protein [Deltaproteobacteria bacterium]